MKGGAKMAQTLSISKGEVAIGHDIRKVSSANVDPLLTATNNEIIIDRLKEFDYDIKAYTNARFQPVIDEYNAKQTRKDRKKTKPYVDEIEAKNLKLIAKAAENKAKGIKKSVKKPTELVHEFVFQVGNRDTNGTLTTDMDKNKQYARKLIEGLQEKYPHMEILLATFHGDETDGTPHLHIISQFVGEGYKEGLSRQISISKALEADGIERASHRDSDFSLDKWIDDVKDSIMQPLLSEIFQEEREMLNEKREHIPTAIFREKARNEEIEIECQRNENVYAVEAIEQLKQEQQLEIDIQQVIKEYAIESIDYVLTHKHKKKEKELDEREQELNELDDELQEVISNIQETVADLDNREAELLEGVDELNEQLYDLECEKSVLHGEIEELGEREFAIDERERWVELDEQDIDACFERYYEYVAELDEREQELNNREENVTERETNVTERETNVTERETKATELLQEIEESDSFKLKRMYSYAKQLKTNQGTLYDYLMKQEQLFWENKRAVDNMYLREPNNDREYQKY